MVKTRIKKKTLNELRQIIETDTYIDKDSFNYCAYKSRLKKDPRPNLVSKDILDSITNGLL